MKKIINIKDYYPAFISSRKSISILKNQVDFSIKGKDITFDFSKITFISRSFAHEFIKFTKTNNLNIDIINTNINVSAMFSAVRKTETSNRRKFEDVPVTTFKNKAELNSFFATI